MLTGIFFLIIIEIGEKNNEEASLSDLLQFCTGDRQLPPMGLCFPLKVELLPNSPVHCMPTTAACFGLLAIPIIYTAQDEFTTAMNKGVLYSLNRYGLE